VKVLLSYVTTVTERLTYPLALGPKSLLIAYWASSISNLRFQDESEFGDSTEEDMRKQIKVQESRYRSRNDAGFIIQKELGLVR